MTPRRLRHRLTTAAGPVLAGTPWLLRRMRAEFDTRGRLSAPTAAWMYATYTAHGALYVHALTRSGRSRPPGTVAVAGLATAALGTGLCTAGMARFTGPAQVTGTDEGRFATDGIYRYTRNPQYAGYSLALIGASLARGSAGGVALAATMAGIFAWWVPVEERHLAHAHGQAYREYRARTHRWVGTTARQAVPRHLGNLAEESPGEGRQPDAPEIRKRTR